MSISWLDIVFGLVKIQANDHINNRQHEHHKPQFLNQNDRRDAVSGYVYPVPSPTNTSDYGNFPETLQGVPSDELRRPAVWLKASRAHMLW
jgi:hypothetical protein